MQTFRLGLTMAGAISAGAYTAGVFDFLTEALDEWERRKAELRAAGTPESEWEVPSHTVDIPAMSGASAGGITAALGIIALAEQTPPGAVPQVHRYPQVGEVTVRLPRLYRAWVQLIRFVDEKGGPDLLSQADLREGPVASLLDTSILTRIVEASLLDIHALAPPRPYLDRRLHVFLTHSNLRGVPYEIGFATGLGGQQGYGMMCHADRRHFVFEGAGTATCESLWARPDPATVLRLAELPDLTRVDGVWQDFGEAVLGTSAFPVGLRGRMIEPPTVAEYVARQWPIQRYAEDPETGERRFRLPLAFPEALAAAPDSRVGYVTLDGGMINNEPFELVRWSLMEDPPKPNPREAEAADRAVLMIDPFPAPPEYDVMGSTDAGLSAVLRRLFPTMLNQARFKPSDLADALDECVFSRFLIAPRRRQGPGEPLEPHPIACGLLGGFGGFLNEEFRAHDYQLGRLNCYLFLKDALALPLSNPIIADGYRGRSQRAHFTTDSGVPGNPEPYYQVIPLVGSAARMPSPPKWPLVSRAEVDTMVERTNGRATALFRRLLDSEINGRAARTGARLAWNWFGEGTLRSFVQYALLKDLILRGQLEGPTAGRPQPERKVIAALADPAYDFRTPIGISRQTGVAVAEVERILALPHYAALVHRRDGRHPVFTLQERAPNGVGTWFGIRHAKEWLAGAPAVN